MSEISIIIGVLFYFAVIGLIIVSAWKINTKANQPGWACLIPFYSTFVTLEIVGKPAIWLLWILLPIVNIVFGIWMLNLLAKSFGKSEGFTVGMILLPFIFFPILGLGSATYQGPAGLK